MYRCNIVTICHSCQNCTFENECSRALTDRLFAGSSFYRFEFQLGILSRVLQNKILTPKESYAFVDELPRDGKKIY